MHRTAQCSNESIQQGAATCAAALVCCVTCAVTRCLKLALQSVCHCPALQNWQQAAAAECGGCCCCCCLVWPLLLLLPMLQLLLSTVPRLLPYMIAGFSNLVCSATWKLQHILPAVYSHLAVVTAVPEHAHRCCWVRAMTDLQPSTATQHCCNADAQGSQEPSRYQHEGFQAGCRFGGAPDAISGCAS